MSVEKEREYVEAVPGPAIVITKAELVRMQQTPVDIEARENRWAKIEKFIQQIHDETHLPEDEENILS